MLLPVTSLYASLTGILYVTLSFAVIRVRRELKVPYGDGGHRILTKRIAAHRNASEYIPVLLAMIALIEGAHFAHVAWLHVLGLMLLLGRLSHAYAIALDGTPFQFRFYGMLLTLSALIFSCCTLLCQAVAYSFSS